jgi:hypothetical protein
VRKVITLFALVLTLALPASASGEAPLKGKWLDYPSCTATADALTCSGRAAGIPRLNNNPLETEQGLGAPTVAVFAAIRFTCLNNPFPFVVLDVPFAFAPRVAAPFQNGQSFALTFSAPPGPQSLGAQAGCFSGIWERDPNYYDVRVAIGWGYGSCCPVSALEAQIGTVVPGG